MTADLLSEIKILREQLEDKEKDLKKAAEIGQSLLQSNRELEMKITEITSNPAGIQQNACSSCKSIRERIRDLEFTHNEALIQYEKLQDQFHKQADELRSTLANCKRLDGINLELKEEIASLTGRCGEMERLIQKYESGKSTWNTEIDLLNQEISKQENIIRSLKCKQEYLEQELEISNDKRSEHNSEIQSLKEEIDKITEQLNESNELVDTYQTYREKVESLEDTIEQLNHEIDCVRDLNQSLTSRLALLEPEVASSAPDQGSKTLLSEIEDKRLELISEHKLLEQQHAGLAESHTKSLHRQVRMKHQIARLSQLNSIDQSQEKCLKLEQALAQCESEKNELEAQIDKLQRHRVNLTPDWDFDDENAPSGDDKTRILEFQVQQLLDECESLKKSNKTLRLVKAAETSKLLETVSKMNEKTKELDNLKRQFSKLKYEFDEMQINVTEPVVKIPKIPDIPTNQAENENKENNNSLFVIPPSPMGTRDTELENKLQISPEMENSKPAMKIKSIKVQSKQDQECKQQ